MKEVNFFRPWERSFIFMDTYSLIRFILVLISIVIALGMFIRTFVKGNTMSTRFIARTAVFAAISIVLYTIPFLKFSLPIFPSFLEIHLDEIPAFMAGFAYGPLAGFLVILVKTLVKLPLSSTACVGEVADFIYSVAFVVPATIIYKKHRSIKGALVSMLVATIVQLAVASSVTSFVMLDIYGKLFHLSRGTILKMCQAVNPLFKNVTDTGTSFLFRFMLLVSVPFNAIKDAIVVLVTFLLYKRLRLLFKKIDAQKN